MRDQQNFKNTHNKNESKKSNNNPNAVKEMRMDRLVVYSQYVTVEGEVLFCACATHGVSYYLVRTVHVCFLLD